MFRFIIYSCCVLLSVAGCQEKTIQPPDDANPPYVEPGTAFNPSPADGATGLGMNFEFSWECESPYPGPVTFAVYLGQDSLRILRTPATESSFLSPWSKQSHASKVLLQIYRMQTAYRLQHGAYCLNGVVASAMNPAGFSQLLVRIDSSDSYTYVITSAMNSFTCGAYATDLDPEDPQFDAWAIDESGVVSIDINDLEVPYQPGATYSWQVIYINDFISIPGPIWQFTTSPDSMPADYQSNLPSEPFPLGAIQYDNDDIVFYWQTRDILNPPLVYDFYLGIDGNLQLRAQSLTNPAYYSDWRRQNRVQEMLEEIRSLQNSYRAANGSYCLDGATASLLENGFAMLGVTFNSEDLYTYAMTADRDNFTCTAIANLDVDDAEDIWTIADGYYPPFILNNDCDVPFLPGTEYTWRVVVRDNRGNERVGPIWQLYTQY
jgi:type II secretory pathway pseudopilin PulG